MTNRDPDWHRVLEGFPQRAYAYFEKELAPRGFQLKAEILDWPGGIWRCRLLPDLEAAG